MATPTKSPPVLEQKVTQAAIATLLGLDVRQVRNLQKSEFEGGLPKEPDGYLPSRCVGWYVRFKVHEAQARTAPKGSGISELDQREQLAKIQILEVNAAKAKGEVVPLADHQQELRRVLGAVAGRLTRVDGEFGPRAVGLASLGDAREMIRDLAATLRSEMSTAAVPIGPVVQVPASALLAHVDEEAASYLRDLPEGAEVHLAVVGESSPAA